jgi:hypothetical protein
VPKFDLAAGTRIPVISDTHGLLRPDVHPYLVGAPFILHAAVNDWFLWSIHILTLL